MFLTEIDGNSGEIDCNSNVATVKSLYKNKLYFCIPAKRYLENDIKRKQFTPSAQILISYHHPTKRELESFRKMSDSGSGAGRIRNEHGLSDCSRKQGHT